MTELNQIYKCLKCENIAEVVHAGGGNMVCCGEPMELLVEKQEEEGLTEKHLPVVEKTEKGVKVKIGEIPHPMIPEHYIEWIEILADGKVYKKFLKPGDAPEAEFCVEAENIVAREYCNIHGLWKS